MDAKARSRKPPGVSCGRSGEWAPAFFALAEIRLCRTGIRTELSSVGNRKCFVPFGECPIFHSGLIGVPQP